MALESVSSTARLASIETKLEHIEEKLEYLDDMRVEFIALKARWGLVSAIIGAGFAALVTIIVNFIDGVMS